MMHILHFMYDRHNTLTRIYTAKAIKWHLNKANGKGMLFFLIFFLHKNKSLLMFIFIKDYVLQHLFNHKRMFMRTDQVYADVKIL